MADVDEYNTENLNYEAEVSDAGEGADNADEMEVNALNDLNFIGGKISNEY